MPKKKVVHPKMDRYLIAINQPYEVEWVKEVMLKKYGITTEKVEIKNAVKRVGHLRRKVYAFIRSCHV